MDIKNIWNNKPIVLDGAMGTALIKKGFNYDVPFPMLNISHGEIIKNIHREYINAGADIIYTNTFTVSLSLANGKMDFDLLPTVKGIEIAKQAVENSDCLVALNIGPAGRAFSLSVEEMYEIFSKQAKLGEKHGANLIVLETFTDLMQLETAVTAVRDSSSLPVMASMHFKENGTTADGTDICQAAAIAMGHGITAFGINCVAADKILPLIKELKAGYKFPVFIKANAGPIKDGEGKYSHSIDQTAFLNYMKQAKELDINIIGGCCGTDEGYIKLISDLLKG